MKSNNFSANSINSVRIITSNFKKSHIYEPNTSQLYRPTASHTHRGIYCHATLRVYFQRRVLIYTFILYRAMEEGRIANNGIYESNQLEAKDIERVSIILDKIVGEGRIEKNDAMFIKK